MPELIKPIQFSGTKDIHQLIHVLQKNDLIRILNDSQIEADTAGLSRHFLVANDGQTYLLEDIQQLSKEEAAESNISFKTKNNQEEKSLIEVWKIIRRIDKQPAHLKFDIPWICNKPLAEALTTIDPSPDRLLNLIPPQCFFGKEVFPLVFPVITPQERTYEGNRIKDWLNWCTRKEKETRYPEPSNNSPLTESDLLPNVALEQLISVNFQQEQQEKKKQLLFIINEIQQERRLPTQKVKQLIQNLENWNENYENYETHLEVMQQNLIVKMSSFQKIKNASDNIISQHPEWEENEEALRKLLVNYLKTHDITYPLIQKMSNTFLMGVLPIGTYFGFVIYMLVTDLRLPSSQLTIPLISMSVTSIVFCLDYVISKLISNFCRKSMQNIESKVTDIRTVISYVNNIKPLIENYTAQLDTVNIKLKDISVFNVNKKLEELYQLLKNTEKKQNLSPVETHRESLGLNVIFSAPPKKVKEEIIININEVSNETTPRFSNESSLSSKVLRFFSRKDRNEENQHDYLQSLSKFKR
jgi:hypothetical protein